LHWPATHDGFEFGTRHEWKQVPQFEMSVCRSGALLLHIVLLPPLPPAPVAPRTPLPPRPADPAVAPVPPLPPRPAMTGRSSAAAAGVGMSCVDDDASVRWDQLNAEIPDAVVASGDAEDRDPH
jgi:hypothetical protein